MTAQFQWTKEVYEASVSSRCWWFTAYDEGWQDGGGIAADEELKAIVQMEMALGVVPEWARQVVEKSINCVPPCGHYSFPRGYLDAVSAVGSQDSSALLHSYCFAVDPNRKRAFMDYCLCLDAWLAGVSPAATARELTNLGYRKIDWNEVCRDLWQVLGEHTELKDLLVERVLHQTRWWIKSSVWDDDLAPDFGRDEYLGDYCETGCFAADNGNPDIAAPAFRQDLSPRVQRMEARLAEVCPDWDWFRAVIIEASWPCAPKAFRYLEKLLCCIGRERPVISLPSWPVENPEEVPGFLRCEDTWPNQDAAAVWWESFLSALRGWWQGRLQQGAVADDVNHRLGEPTPIKRWLVRLFVRRLEVAATQGGNLGLLVNPPPDARRGA